METCGMCMEGGQDFQKRRSREENRSNFVSRAAFRHQESECTAIWTALKSLLSYQCVYRSPLSLLVHGTVKPFTAWQWLLCRWLLCIRVSSTVKPRPSYCKKALFVVRCVVKRRRGGGYPGIGFFQCNINFSGSSKKSKKLHLSGCNDREKMRIILLINGDLPLVFVISLKFFFGIYPKLLRKDSKGACCKRSSNISA